VEQLDAALASEQTDIDFLILGDFAQMVGGKVYIMGGGWSRFSPPLYPANVQFGIAVGVRVPYMEAEDPHHVELIMESADGGTIWKVDADLETGRPPGTKGESQLAMLALSGGAQLKQPGEFVIRAKVDHRERKRISFRAVASPNQRFKASA
jgi:hypothetical protein